MKNCIRSLVCMICSLAFLSFFACKNSAGGDGGKVSTHTHSFVDYSVTKIATTSSDGLKVQICSCGEKRSVTIPKLSKYQFFESPVLLTDQSFGTYVLFGDWPQTVLETTHTLTFNEGDAITRGELTMIPASDGNYYVKVTENGNSKSYTYSDGTNVKLKSDSSTRYFKVEPIKWWVVTGSYPGSNEMLLLSQYMLTSNVPYYSGDQNKTRTIGTETNIYPNNYKYSQLRAYLNGIEYYDDSSAIVSTYKDKGFLQSAFTATAQSKIITTTVDNSLESTQDANKTLSPATGYECADTYDKIFLLSEKEVTTASYGFNPECRKQDIARIRIPADYALANKVYLYKDLLGWGSLRSPYAGNYKYYVYHMNSTGESASYISTLNDDLGIVPALSVSF